MGSVGLGPGCGLAGKGSGGVAEVEVGGGVGLDSLAMGRHQTSSHVDAPPVRQLRV